MKTRSKKHNEESIILQKIGCDSKEYQEIWKKINSTDAENYIRVEASLKEFGHPNIDSVGKEATRTPWIVIHHSLLYEHRIADHEALCFQRVTAMIDTSYVRQHYGLIIQFFNG